MPSYMVNKFVGQTVRQDFWRWPMASQNPAHNTRALVGYEEEMHAGISWAAYARGDDCNVLSPVSPICLEVRDKLTRHRR